MFSDRLFNFYFFILCNNEFRMTLSSRAGFSLSAWAEFFVILSISEKKATLSTKLTTEGHEE
jgi:hypothetical protein